jgi:hypothetical protein
MSWLGEDCTTETNCWTEQAMTAPETHTGEKIDRKTSRSICDAVGERLQQFLRPHQMDHSPYLGELIEELRRRENEHGMSTPGQGGRQQFFR